MAYRETKSIIKDWHYYKGFTDSLTQDLLKNKHGTGAKVYTSIKFHFQKEKDLNAKLTEIEKQRNYLNSFNKRYKNEDFHKISLSGRERFKC